MKSVVSRHIGIFALTAAVSCGCADMVTFSKDSHAKGMEYLAAKDYPNAAGAFRNAVKQVPNDYEDHYYLAQSYAAQGAWQQSISSYRDAWEIMNLSNMGRADQAMKQKVLDGMAVAIARSDTRDSETNAVEAKAQQRQSSEDYLLLGKVYAARGDADSAIESYNRAAMIDPQSFLISKEYGLYLEKLGQNPRAEIQLRRAYSMDAGDQQVNAALRRVGVVPGPAIKEQDALVKPLVPRGPIPEVDLGKVIGAGSTSPGGSAASGPRD